MKKTISSKLQLLAYLSTLTKFTKVSIKDLNKTYRLGYGSLLIQILERCHYIEIKKEGKGVSIRWISPEEVSSSTAKFLHNQLREELDKRYPDRASKKGRKQKEQHKALLENIDKLGEAIKNRAGVNKTIKPAPLKSKNAISKLEAGESILNRSNSTQLQLQLKEIPKKDRKDIELLKKQCEATLKAKLLIGLASIQEVFNGLILDLKESIDKIGLILIICFFASCSSSVEETLAPGEGVLISDIDRMNIYENTDNLVMKIAEPIPVNKEFQALINGEVKTDIITGKNKVSVFIARFNKIAVLEMQKYNIPASITLAQGILESSSGSSTLATENNNYFGVKCFSRTCKPGHCTNRTDDSHKDFFKVYPTAWSSFRDHSLLLQKGRYKGLKKCKDYKSFAKELQRSGYATSKSYSRKLIRIIEKYNLDRFD